MYLNYCILYCIVTLFDTKQILKRPLSNFNRYIFVRILNTCSPKIDYIIFSFCHMVNPPKRPEKVREDQQHSISLQDFNNSNFANVVMISSSRLLVSRAVVPVARRWYTHGSVVSGPPRTPVWTVANLLLYTSTKQNFNLSDQEIIIYI